MTRRAYVAQVLANGDIDGLLAFHRAHFPGARMEDPPAPPAPAPTPTAAPAPAPVTVPQDQVNAIVARTKTETEASATAELLKRLGFATVEEAEEAAKRAKAADDAAKTQAQRDAADAAKAKTEADALKAEAATERHTAKVERALATGGLDVANETLLRAGLAALNLKVDADDATIKTAVEQLKKDAPALFGTATTTTTTTHSAPPNPNPNPTTPPSEFGKEGHDEALRRYPQLAKTS